MLGELGRSREEGGWLCEYIDFVSGRRRRLPSNKDVVVAELTFCLLYKSDSEEPEDDSRTDRIIYPTYE